ncbi:hypothetical protein, partial [Pseudomonas aeruginosa]|uniref:hypothetical protein n=1 Tax=Pseudomonas aeruginosa TaxID=287 RepID=UPI0022370CF2
AAWASTSTRTAIRARLADFQAQARMAVLVEVEAHAAVEAVAARFLAGIHEKRFRHLFDKRNERVLETHFVTVFHGEFHLFFKFILNY